MTARRAVVCDTETSSLDCRAGWALEVGWHDLETDESGVFVPPHPVQDVLRLGDPAALNINKYRERLMRAPQDTDWAQTRALNRRLQGATLVGANPAFDAGFLSALFDRANLIARAPWHYRLDDIEAAAKGVFHLDYVPSCREVCERLGVIPGWHTASSDVRAEVAAYRALQSLSWAAAEDLARRWNDHHANRDAA